MKISGYTTTRNSIEMNYPFRESIRSMLSFCDEVIVVDSSDRDDGTQEALEELMEEYSHLDVYHIDVDYSVPNFGVWDGKLKAIARDQCSNELCWQQDTDEVVHTDPSFKKKLDQLISDLGNLEGDPNKVLMALPVVEYWGSEGKVRVDVNPWKWRLSRNDPDITHGIPVHLRKEEDGLLYAKPGTDGCDYIYKSSGKIVPCLSFLDTKTNELRLKAIKDDKACAKYEDWFNQVVETLPTVYHFSWWSVAEKIRKFRHTWNKQWQSLYNTSKEPGWNPFFQQPLREMSEEAINRYARFIETETGGHIFHQPWNFERINHVTIKHDYPDIIKEWAENNKTKP